MGRNVQLCGGEGDVALHGAEVAEGDGGTQQAEQRQHRLTTTHGTERGTAFSQSTLRIGPG